MGELAPTNPPNSLVFLSQAADQAAAAHAIAGYRSRKADNTLKSQDNDLTLFVRFFSGAGAVEYTDMLNPTCWQHITYGLVEAFVKWLLSAGYSVASVNRALSTVKVYAKLAAKSGTVGAEQLALIRTVQGYSQKEARRINERRETVRIGRKKSEHVSISKSQARALKSQPGTPQGRRDNLLMALLLDLGLRVGEVALLAVGSLNLKDSELKFYRPKVDKEQTHRLSRDCLKAAQAYEGAGDMPIAAAAPLLRASRKDGSLTQAGMSERAITARVRILGYAVGIESLSAHDCRHFWATSAARGKTDAFRLQEAGGWNSLAMPRRYIEEAEIANEGVVLE